VLASDPAQTRETRKVVTVLFCDMVGSTALADQRDPELQHWIVTRYFDAMRESIEQHGGTVAKFIGDAVMGVFGTPVLHEDDALRAIRAAAAMREALVGLNADLERSVDVRLQIRIGVNTGEAIVGDVSRSDTMVTGDLANMASRLQTSAAPGEILLGEATYALTRDAITAEPLAPMTVKGKEEPLRAHRLLGVAPGARARPARRGSAFVGRERELALIRETFARTVRSRSCHLLTVLGHPGVGKSRLVGEAIRDAHEGATVLEGACLPYGEGTTFWPLTEIVRAAAGEGGGDLREQLTGLVHGEANAADVVDGVIALLHGAGEERRTEERFWAVRRLLGAIARKGPLAVVFDDIQWAETMLLDLVEHIADWSRDAPLLLVCIARPELLETRPGWGGGKPNAASMLLDPLTEGESGRLIEQRLGALELPEAIRRRVLEAAEGYPLFVEELISMLVEDGTLSADLQPDRIRIPATINLLLASRIDRLPPDERDVLERAAVEGALFHRGAVGHLAETREEAQLDAILEQLVHKELIAPERPQLRGEQAFRFRHILIRDAAYEALPKRSRAGLHERFAQWLGTVASAEAADEFVGYHLEQAFRYRRELHRPEPEDRELAGRAARHLAAAGRRAQSRGDSLGASKLLRRSVALFREDGGPPPEMLIELGTALMETGDLPGGDASFAEAVEAASRHGDERLATRAGVQREHLRMQVDPDYDVRQLLDVAEAAIGVFTDLGDQAGVAAAMMRVADVHWSRCRFAQTEEVLEQALVHASRAGDRLHTLQILELLGRAIVIGPRPVEEGARRCEEILELARDEPRLTAWTKSMLAVLEAMRGHGEEARGLYDESHRGLAELGLILLGAGARMYAGVAEIALGDWQAAEREFRHGYDTLTEIGEQSVLSTMAAFLAWTLAAQGQEAEAEQLTAISERAAPDADIASQVVWRGARARVLALRGDIERAELLAVDAVQRGSAADFLNTQADVLMELAHVRRLAGRAQEAAAAAAEALALYEAKGNTVAAGRAREAVDASHA
jgi:class 3 adenylate cyclase/tetratricopeptide (TPR) repeat protein